MTKCAFQGSEEIVAMLDDAVGRRDVHQVTQAVKDGLCKLIRERKLDLPEDLKRTDPNSYARRLLFRSPQNHYEVIAMVWGPGQGTPLHDHAGIWCVDGVLEGQVAVTQFDLKEERGGKFRFEAQQTVEAGVGSAGSLIPPFEYHTINNPTSQTSITIHVYGGQMDCCTIFEAGEDGWYARRRKDLTYSA